MSSPELEALKKRVRDINNPTDRSEAIRELLQRSRAGEFKAEPTPDPPEGNKRDQLEALTRKVREAANPKERRVAIAELVQRAASGEFAEYGYGHAKEADDVDVFVVPFIPKQEPASPEATALSASSGKVLRTRTIRSRCDPGEYELAKRYAQERAEWPKVAIGAGVQPQRGRFKHGSSRDPDALHEFGPPSTIWHSLGERSFEREMKIRARRGARMETRVNETRNWGDT